MGKHQGKPANECNHTYTLRDYRTHKGQSQVRNTCACGKKKSHWFTEERGPTKK